MVPELISLIIQCIKFSERVSKSLELGYLLYFLGFTVEYTTCLMICSYYLLNDNLTVIKIQNTLGVFKIQKQYILDNQNCFVLLF